MKDVRQPNCVIKYCTRGTANKDAPHPVSNIPKTIPLLLTNQRAKTGALAGYAIRLVPIAPHRPNKI